MPHMPKPKIVEVRLPGYPEDDPAIVRINTNFLAGDALDVAQHENQMVAAVAALEKIIVGWNFSDDDGAEVPVSVESIRSMSATDFKYLDEAVRDLIAAQTTPVADVEKKS